MAKANTNDAYNWAKENLAEWFARQDVDRKNISVATLDNYMRTLLTNSFVELWDYFDVYGYIVDGLDNRLVIRNDETGQFTLVSKDTLCKCCKTLNNWVIDHHGKDYTVFVILSE